MEKYIAKLSLRLPEVKFVPSGSFYWSPKNSTISFADSLETENVWALYHEAGHAFLDHRSYKSDFELLKMEAQAWDEAIKLAQDDGITIDEEHVQDCLDTYRDWLHQRSSCPSCSVVSMQTETNKYRCHNCHTSWKVTTSRFCRPYRMRQTETTTNKQSAKKHPQIEFA